MRHALSKKTLAFIFAISAIILFIFSKRAEILQLLSVAFLSLGWTLILSPLHSYFQRKGISSGTAAGICISILIFFMLLMLLTFLPYLLVHTASLIERLTPVLADIVRQIEGLIEHNPAFHVLKGANLFSIIANSAAKATAGLAKGGMAFATLTGNLVFSLVIAFYLLCEKNVIANHLLLFVPYSFRGLFLRSVHGCKNALLGYLAGLLKTSLFVSAFSFIGLSLLGIREALLLAIFMGVFEVLPYIGPVLASIPIILSALPLGLVRTLLTLLVVIGIQQAESSFVGPYITASCTSIHPLLALCSVFVSGLLFGLPGILLGIPAVIVIRTLLHSFRQAENDSVR